MSKFPGSSFGELWILFGVREHFRIIAAHTNANSLGEEKTGVLLFSLKITGCDIVSSFSSVGKITARDTLATFPEITKTFKCMSNMPVTISDEHICLLQRFVIFFYDRTSECTKVNQARQIVFARGGN